MVSACSDTALQCMQANDESEKQAIKIHTDSSFREAIHTLKWFFTTVEWLSMSTAPVLKRVFLCRTEECVLSGGEDFALTNCY